jgi:PAS domain S-box-containing protein
VPSPAFICLQVTESSLPTFPNLPWMPPIIALNCISVEYFRQKPLSLAVLVKKPSCIPVPVRPKLVVRAIHRIHPEKRLLRSIPLSIEKPSCKNGLDTILDRISDGFFALDTHWCFTQLNCRAAALAPRKPEALIGKSIWKMFPGTIGSIVWTEFQRAVDDNIHVCFSYYSSCLGRWYEVSAYPSDEGLSVFFHDTTDRYKAFEARASLERAVAFRADVSNALCKTDAPLGTILQGCAEAVVRHTDAAFAQIWLMKDAENLLELHASAGLYTHPDCPDSRIPVGDLKIGQIAATRQGYVTNNIQVDPLISDKEWAKREGMISFAGYPLLLGNKVIGVMAIFARHRLKKDLLDNFASIASAITQGIERKRTEQAFRDSEETLRLAAEATELGTWDWDLTTNTLSLNERTRLIFGLAPESELSYELFLKLIHLDDRDRVHNTIKQSLNPRGNGDYDIAYRVVRQDGILKWVREKGKVTFKGKDLERRPVRFVGTVIDITDSKKTEEELREANRAKDEFLATLSHELRTPLTAIYGWASLLRGGRLSQEKIVNAYEVIERNTRAQLQLVDDLLNVSRVTLGKVKIVPKWLEPRLIIDPAVESIRPAAAAKGIDVRTQGDGQGHVFADPDRLQQVVYNLLTNALKFTEKGGEIIVKFGRIGDKFDISVRDTGEGIRPDFLPFVFDRFRQADSSTTRKHGGLGLGLNIVRTITEMHGGTVVAHSEGKGKGTTMTVELPLPAFRQVETDQKESKHESLNGLTVMVVEDEQDTRCMLGEAVQLHGASVILVSSAAEALAQLNRQKPDVLVSDIAMPDMDGYQLIHAIRAELPAESKDIPAVALSAFASADDQKKSIQAGYRAHLSKPVAVQDLVSILAGVANQKHLDARMSLPDRIRFSMPARSVTAPNRGLR